MNYSKLKSLIKQKRITNEMIADRLDLSQQAIQASLYREKLRIEYFEEICQMLEMHPGEFFDGDFIAPPSADARKLLQAKDEQVELLREQISLQKEMMKLKDEQLKACLQEKGRTVPMH